ncbi:hypothetical protein SKAU_G00252810 [Synaphobranchus kaupii]|uniref:Uncharacterized protein n=1 Tax=Synaphobranchus kaupii TaxID=118154 RepID=A0A9Q1IR41_SYNKA|nr:hypothetical protein SKAU_G00252810 [Synaphobranchus kaupii]
MERQSKHRLGLAVLSRGRAVVSGCFLGCRRSRPQRVFTQSNSSKVPREDFWAERESQIALSDPSKWNITARNGAVPACGGVEEPDLPRPACQDVLPVLRVERQACAETLSGRR